MDKVRSLWDAIKVEEEAEPQPSTSGAQLSTSRPHQYEEFKASGGWFQRFKKCSHKVSLASCFPPPTSLSALTLAARQAGSLFTYAWLWQHLPVLCPVFTMAPKRLSASPAGGDTPKRALTEANLSDLLAQSIKILEENYPNIERSTAVIRGVMEKIMCYEVLLKEKQQSITSFFRPHTPSQVTESKTNDDNGDTSEKEVAK
ncbi:hypothetical protein E2C01_035835 [Portunus trituberculatus]|uniref:HTH CENPB-type domain-containing protein n=1 Tax=Portunus trituberculatus TaxID=210409 RepID=A0A5B7FAD8_PORTR|nr:hypothetical protein [Portunus trituberculatus]